MTSGQQPVASEPFMPFEPFEPFVPFVPAECRAEAAELSWDLACVHGALQEIATCWRRAFAGRPELPLRLPLQLAITAQWISVEVARLVDSGPGQPPALAVHTARRFAAFRRDITAAQALTGGTAGDAQLWESVDRALRRASSSLLWLIVQLVQVDTDWSPTPLAGSGAWDGAGIATGAAGACGAAGAAAATVPASRVEQTALVRQG